MPTFNREQDGTTYYLKNGVLFGSPTFTNGEYDEENEIEVSEYAEPLSSNEIADIMQNLK